MIKQIHRYFFAKFMDDDEQILFVAHRHLFVHMQDLLRRIFFGMVIPGFFYWLFPELIFGWLIWGAIGFGVFLYGFFDWFYDVWLFTNVGVVDVRWNGFFDRSASRVDYHMIEGVSYSITGFWATIFNYGDVVLERLGAANPVVLKDAYRPHNVERRFTYFHTHFLDERRNNNHENLKDLLTEMLKDHIKRQDNE